MCQNYPKMFSSPVSVWFSCRIFHRMCCWMLLLNFYFLYDILLISLEFCILIMSENVVLVWVDCWPSWAHEGRNQKTAWDFWSERPNASTLSDMMLYVAVLCLIFHYWFAEYLIDHIISEFCVNIPKVSMFHLSFTGK